ncbi:MAG: carboxylesterase family protein [Burkholderiaceae bacterium]
MQGDVGVRFPGGQLLGNCSGGVCCFRAIPYAASTAGARRFKPPQPIVPWSGVVDARLPGPVAPQLPSRLRSVMGDFERAQSEDCLRLTVWTPGCDSRSRPVLFWLHGGAYTSGAGDLDWYDGARLAHEGDIVVVSPNYRLGALGFLMADGVSDGNLGLLDQEAALHWVHRYIAHFGGNPDCVTIMGQSAGANSAVMLLARQDAARPLVQRAILQSPALGIRPYSPARSAEFGEEFLRVASAGLGQAPLIDNALDLSVARVLEAQRESATLAADLGITKGLVDPPFAPVGDGVVVPTDEAYDVALERAAGQVDVIVGWNADEMSAFIPPDSRSPKDIGDPDALHRQQAAETYFRAPVRRWLADAARQGRRAWAFSFDWAPQGSMIGACHCIELPFVFGTAREFAGAPMLRGGDPDEVECLSRLVRRMWVDFIRTGNPGQSMPSDLPDWSHATMDRKPVLHIDSACRVECEQPDTRD